MKWLIVVLTVCLLALVANYSYGKGARTLTLSDSQVGEIRTAIGFSTILQFDSRPSSVVVGDQDAFKIEYVGNSLTVKPVLPSTRTNLFVFTDYDRYNFTLVSSRRGEVDYTVVVKRKRSESSPTQVMEPQTIAEPPKSERAINKKVTVAGTTLSVQRASQQASGTVSVIAFTFAKAGKPVTFEAGDIDIRQQGKSVPIENLYLESAQLSQRPIHAQLVLRRGDFKESLPVTLTFTPPGAHSKTAKVTFSLKGNAQ